MINLKTSAIHSFGTEYELLYASKMDNSSSIILKNVVIGALLTVIGIIGGIKMAIDGFHKSIHSIGPVGGTIGIVLAIFSLFGIIGCIQKIAAAMKDHN
jgi:hypothetical protein